MIRFLPIAAAAMLAGCANTTPVQQAAITAAISQGVTLGAALAGSNKTARQVIDAGALVCSVQGQLFAILGTNVVGAPKAAMDAACAAIGGVGSAVTAGVDPASVGVATVQPTVKPAA